MRRHTQPLRADSKLSDAVGRTIRLSSFVIATCCTAIAAGRQRSQHKRRGGGNRRAYGHGRGFNGREHLRHVAAHFPELGVRLDEPLQRSKDGVAKRLAIAAAVALRATDIGPLGQLSLSAGGRDSHWRQRAMLRCAAAGGACGSHACACVHARLQLCCVFVCVPACLRLKASPRKSCRSMSSSPESRT